MSLSKVMAAREAFFTRTFSVSHRAFECVEPVCDGMRHGWHRRPSPAVKTMKKRELPEELRAFVVEYVDSIAHLEALLLLFRNHGVSLRNRAMAEQLYTDEKTVAGLLERLVALGLASTDGNACRYHAPHELDRLVRLLDQRYVEDLISITDMIHAK